MSKTQEIHVNASITFKVFGGIYFDVMTENWKHLKDPLAFSSFFVYWNRNRILLTSDLLPNISQIESQSFSNTSLVVGQSSMNISLALRARDISTSRLTSSKI